MVKTLYSILHRSLDLTEQNIDGIYLGTIDKFISAQYFYSNNGFREIKRGDLPSSFPKLDVDNRFYYRNLKD